MKSLKPGHALGCLVYLCAVCLAGLWSSTASAQLRIGTYNVWNNPDNTTEDNSMRSVFSGIADQSINGIAKPLDILALQETDNAGLSRIPRLLGEVNPAGDYQIINTASVGGDRNAIVYDRNSVELLETVVIPTAGPRDTLRARFRPVGYTSPGAEFYVYASHLRASQGNSQERESEVNTIRNNADALGEDASIMYLGDFNFYSVNELGYNRIRRSGNGQAFDPVVNLGNKVPGTRDDTFPSSGRRFDFQFITNDLFDGEGLDLIDDSYRVFYGSGDSISDHRPVIADYQLPAVMKADLQPIATEFSLGEPAQATLSVQNMASVLVAIGADELDFTVSATGDASGSFSGSLSALEPEAGFVIALDTSTAGTKTGTVFVQANSPGVESPDQSFQITYSVVPEPSSLIAWTVVVLIAQRRRHS